MSEGTDSDVNYKANTVSEEGKLYRVGRGFADLTKGYRTLDSNLPSEFERFSPPLFRFMQVPPGRELHLTGPGGTLEGVRIPGTDYKILEYKVKGPGLRFIFGLGVGRDRMF